jgi:UDP-N-acetyl-D-mannosaminuronate dehydrogenase
MLNEESVKFSFCHHLYLCLRVYKNYLKYQKNVKQMSKTTSENETLVKQIHCVVLLKAHNIFNMDTQINIENLHTIIRWAIN